MAVAKPNRDQHFWITTKPLVSAKVALGPLAFSVPETVEALLPSPIDSQELASLVENVPDSPPLQRCPKPYAVLFALNQASVDAFSERHRSLFKNDNIARTANWRSKPHEPAWFLVESVISGNNLSLEDMENQLSTFTYIPSAREVIGMMLIYKFYLARVPFTATIATSSRWDDMTRVTVHWGKAGIIATKWDGQASPQVHLLKGWLTYK